MIKTVLFVHGTGVRKASYLRTFELLERRLSETAPAVKLKPCLWGESLGARLLLNGASIPEFNGVKVAVPSRDETLALWELLVRDPLFELRELIFLIPDELIPPLEQQRKAMFVESVRLLAEREFKVGNPEDLGIQSEWNQATLWVADSPAFKAAVAGVPFVDMNLRVATSRAIVAALQQRMDDEGIPALSHEIRERLVDQCIDALGGRDLGFTNWMSERLIGLGLHWATVRARRKRDVLFNSAYPNAGDILLYQARGGAIRAFIEHRVNECGEDVALLAHSLGGVACVDLLIERALPNVKLLITAGSQAPFLYEINALSSLPFDHPIPGHFPKSWVNFFDYNDLLSYHAQPVFEGRFNGRAVDIEIDSRQPFPQAHSAYWEASGFWDKLKPYLQ